MQKESKEIDSVKLIALKFISSTPQLMQYCEAVTDLAQKAWDLIWYDETFCFLWQTAV